MGESSVGFLVQEGVEEDVIEYLTDEGSREGPVVDVTIGAPPVGVRDFGWSRALLVWRSVYPGDELLRPVGETRNRERIVGVTFEQEHALGADLQRPSGLGHRVQKPGQRTGSAVPELAGACLGVQAGEVPGEVGGVLQEQEEALGQRRRPSGQRRRPARMRLASGLSLSQWDSPSWLIGVVDGPEVDAGGAQAATSSKTSIAAVERM